ncbi:hypothetical protein BC828DRAFT_417933 [Blastocladiella britannica]|nr:hypothetical protein BC828DRAFT_417933 [Blastocladiella britannica]
MKSTRKPNARGALPPLPSSISRGGKSDGAANASGANGSMASYTSSRRRGSQLSLAQSVQGGGIGGLLGAGGSNARAAELRIFDEDGRDVTPLPLLAPPKPQLRQTATGSQAGESMVAGSQSMLGGSSKAVPQSSALDYFASLEAQTLSQFSSVNFGKSFASFSTAGGSRMSASATDDRSEDETASVTSERSVDDDDDRPYNVGVQRGKRSGGHESAPAGGATSLGGTSGSGGEESDLNRVLGISLCESETITLLDLPAVTVGPDDAELDAVEAMNARYSEVLAQRASSNNFAHRATQTYNVAAKAKDVQAVLVKAAAAEVQVNEWSIHDEWAAIGRSVEAGTDGPTSLTRASASQEALVPLSGAASTMGGTMGNVLDSSTFISSALTNNLDSATSSMAGGGTVTGGGEPSIFGRPDGNQSEVVVPSYLEREVTLQSLSPVSLKESLRIMESAVLETIYSPRLIEYRDFSGGTNPRHARGETGSLAPDSDTFEANIPSLFYLWSFRCELVRDRCVMAVAWNQGNPDILAVAYGLPRSTGVSPSASGNSGTTSSGSGGASGRGTSAQNGGDNDNTTSSMLASSSSGGHGSSPAGLICCWSLKNPEFPQRIFKTTSPVTAVDFSRASPNLLAAGYMDGRIAIFDVRHESKYTAAGNSGAGAGGDAEGTSASPGGASPSGGSSSSSGTGVGTDQADAVCVDSGNLSAKHRDPVWQIRWVEREQAIGDHHARAEAVVSVSTDGRVCMWQLRKGIDGTDLMTLKAVKPPEKKGKSAAGGPAGAPAGGAAPGGGAAAKSGAANGGQGANAAGGKSSFISRSAGGLGFDFHPQDHNTYLVATEDGSVHKCSVSYNEQYLTNYFGHAGAVHRVKWSPFSNNVFATCSADWTVGLWHQDAERTGLKFYSGRDAIMDVDWSPHSPTVLASVSLDGRIEVWDLSLSVLDPTIVHSVLDQKLMCCAFSPSTPVLVTGDDTGSVNVYKLRRLQLFNVPDAHGGGGDDGDGSSSTFNTNGTSSGSQQPNVAELLRERTALLERIVTPTTKD